MDEGAMLAYTEMDWVHFMKKGGGWRGTRMHFGYGARVAMCSLPPHMNALRERDAAINRARRCLSYQCTKNIHAPPSSSLVRVLLCVLGNCVYYYYFFFWV